MNYNKEQQGPPLTKYRKPVRAPAPLGCLSSAMRNLQPSAADNQIGCLRQPRTDCPPMHMRLDDLNNPHRSQSFPATDTFPALVTMPNHSSNAVKNRPYACRAPHKQHSCFCIGTSAAPTGIADT